MDDMPGIATRIVDSQEVKKFLAQEDVQAASKKAFGMNIDAYLIEMKNKHLCSFCKSPALITVDDSNIVLCLHCFRILEHNTEFMRKFFGGVSNH